MSQSLLLDINNAHEYTNLFRNMELIIIEEQTKEQRKRDATKYFCFEPEQKDYKITEDDINYIEEHIKDTHTILKCFDEIEYKIEHFQKIYPKLFDDYKRGLYLQIAKESYNNSNLWWCLGFAGCGILDFTTSIKYMQSTCFNNDKSMIKLDDFRFKRLTSEEQNFVLNFSLRVKFYKWYDLFENCFGKIQFDIFIEYLTKLKESVKREHLNAFALNALDFMTNDNYVNNFYALHHFTAMKVAKNKILDKIFITTRNISYMPYKIIYEVLDAQYDNIKESMKSIHEKEKAKVEKQQKKEDELKFEEFKKELEYDRIIYQNKPEDKPEENNEDDTNDTDEDTPLLTEDDYKYVFETLGIRKRI